MTHACVVWCFGVRRQLQATVVAEVVCTAATCASMDTHGRLLVVVVSTCMLECMECGRGYAL